MIADLLALDLSSTTIGWCASHGGALSWGQATFRGDLDKRLGAFLLWLQPRMPSEVLVIEQPFVEHRSAVAALYGVAGIARGLAASMDVQVVLLSPSEVKRHWTGKAHATKEEMRRAGGPEGYVAGGIGEHALDALAALSCYQCRDYSVKPAKKGKIKVRLRKKAERGSVVL